MILRNSTLMKKQKDNKIRSQLYSLLKKHIQLSHKPFVPNKTPIQYARANVDEEDLYSVVETLLDGWFGLGEKGEQFERKLASYVGVKHACLVNSGSSADLIALATLSSKDVPNHLKEGDEIITPACTFPTLVSSIVHHRLKPVFVDINLETLNPNPYDIEQAITKKTKELFIVHTLGNPNEMDKINEIVKKHHLWLIEDNCDALGSTYKKRKTGTFGHMATESFYPAHHITTAGEGGAVVTNNYHLSRVANSLRDWGRACWCSAGGGPENGVCGHRFDFKIGNVSYDHKYIFSQIGYNLKPIELQAAMGLVQLDKLPRFIQKRRQNFKTLESFFENYQEFFHLHRKTPQSNPSWFAFPITVKDNAPFTRFEITQHLEKNLIQTRPMFAGNILRQPGFRTINHRVFQNLDNSNTVLAQTFFVGVHPGIGKKQIEYMKSIFESFLKKYT